MATTTSHTKSTASKATSTKSNKDSTAQMDAIALLKADHEQVEELFADCESTSSSKKKAELVAEICTALKVHAQIEEEIFYPAVKEAMKDRDLVPEARVEHASIKDLISQLEAAAPQSEMGGKADGEMYDAKIKVLCEYVKHHVKEEQNEIFPKAKATSLDMNQLGAQMAERKAALMNEQMSARR